MIRMLVEVLADARRHRKTQVRVDIDLADRALRRLTKLLLGDADRVGHLAAVFVDDLHEFLRNGGRAMQNDREARQTLGNFVQNVEAQRRRNEDALFIASALFGLELVSAVGGADRDCEGVNASLGNELLDLFRTGVGGILVRKP